MEGQPPLEPEPTPQLGFYEILLLTPAEKAALLSGEDPLLVEYDSSAFDRTIALMEEHHREAILIPHRSPIFGIAMAGLRDPDGRHIYIFKDLYKEASDKIRVESEEEL